MNHTPGPWRIGTNYPCRIIGGGGVIAYACDPQDEGTEREEEKANARLIALAPEMATALRKCVATCDAGFKQLGMSGPDPARMGKIWFETYQEFRALLARLEAETEPTDTPTNANKEG